MQIISCNLQNKRTNKFSLNTRKYIKSWHRPYWFNFWRNREFCNFH